MGNPVFATWYRRWVRCLLPLFLVATLVVLGGSVSFASSGGDHGPVGWMATDSYRVLNFAVLAIAVFFAVRRPVTIALNERIKGITTKLDELEFQKVEAEEKLAEYDKKFAELDKEAELILSEYVRQGEEAKVAILVAAETASKKLKEQAKNNIEHEFVKARTKLRREVVDKALIKAESIIQKHIGSDDQEKLADEYLNKVVA